MKNKNTEVSDKNIRIVNPVQAGAYVANGLNPIEIYWSTDKWVWLFNREASKPLFHDWCRRELKVILQ